MNANWVAVAKNVSNKLIVLIKPSQALRALTCELAELSVQTISDVSK